MNATPPLPEYRDALLKLALERFALPMLAAVKLAKEDRLTHSAQALLEREQDVATAALQNVALLFPPEEFKAKALAYMRTAGIPTPLLFKMNTTANSHFTP
jgi:hypothetical protein